MQFPVSIELRRSYSLSLLLAVFHVAAAGCIVVLPWPWIFRFVLFALIVPSAWYSLRSSRFASLRLSGRGELDCSLVDDKRVSATVFPDSTVFVGLIVLRLRVDDEVRTSSLVLLRDQMTAEQFRVLRLWLRWRSEAKKDGATAF